MTGLHLKILSGSQCELQYDSSGELYYCILLGLFKNVSRIHLAFPLTSPNFVPQLNVSIYNSEIIFSAVKHSGCFIWFFLVKHRCIFLDLSHQVLSFTRNCCVLETILIIGHIQDKKVPPNVTGGKGQGTTLKEWHITQGHNINCLESESRWQTSFNLIRLLISISNLNDTRKGHNRKDSRLRKLTH